MHEDLPEGIDEVAGRCEVELTKRAGGAEVDVEAGDLVVDEGVGEREATDGAGGVLEAELRRVRRGPGMT